jgi:hypothetical protein
MRAQVEKNVMEEEKVRILKESSSLTAEIKKRAQRIAEHTLYLRLHEVWGYADDGEEETISEFNQNLFEIARIRARKTDRIYLQMGDLTQRGWHRAIDIEKMFQRVIKEPHEPWIRTHIDLLSYAIDRVEFEEQVRKELWESGKPLPNNPREVISKEAKRRIRIYQESLPAYNYSHLN